MPKEATVRSIAAATRGKDQDPPSAREQLDNALSEMGRIKAYLKLFEGMAEPDSSGPEMRIDREAMFEVMGELAERMQSASQAASAAYGDLLR